MVKYPEMDPVAFSFGPLSVHWYGIMYLLGFVAAWLIAHQRSRRSWAAVRSHQIEDLVLYSALGVIVGGRLGSALFYNFDKWLADPLWVLRMWEGGMAFHGGLLGVIVAIFLYARKIGQPFLAVADFAAPLAPIGLGLGRIGNFIGQELWGRQTDLPWGMVFPRDVEQLVRHPSQLYQAFFEGLLLFLIVFWYSRRPRPVGSVGGVFLLCYAVFRFAVEFVRQPDAHIGFDLEGWMTRGQILCIPMAIVGILLIVVAHSRHKFLNR